MCNGRGNSVHTSDTEGDVHWYAVSDNVFLNQFFYHKLLDIARTGK